MLDKNVLIDWILPTFVCLPAALLTILVSWQKIFEVVGMDIPEALNIRSGEIKECMLAVFLMMYALSIWYRNKRLAGSTAGESPT